MLNWIKKLCWKWHYFTGGHLMSKCTIEAPRKLFKSSKVPRRNLTEAEIMFGRADEDVDIGDIGLGLYNINDITVGEMAEAKNLSLEEILMGGILSITREDEKKAREIQRRNREREKVGLDCSDWIDEMAEEIKEKKSE